MGPTHDFSEKLTVSRSERQPSQTEPFSLSNSAIIFVICSSLVIYFHHYIEILLRDTAAIPKNFSFLLIYYFHYLIKKIYYCGKNITRASPLKKKKHYFQKN